MTLVWELIKLGQWVITILFGFRLPSSTDNLVEWNTTNGCYKKLTIQNKHME